MKKIILRLVLLVILITFIYYLFESYIIKYNTENKGKISVGKYVSQDKWAKGELNYFVYYINGVKHKENGGRAPKGFSENTGKFYKIIYSEEYENSIKAFYEEEITDTTLILNAGFSKTEIEFKK
jgi:hypothetical protein